MCNNDTDSPPDDTDIEAWRIHCQRVKELSKSDSARAVFELSDMMRALSITGIQKRHPDYNADSVIKAYIRLASGERVFEKFFKESEIRP